MAGELEGKVRLHRSVDLARAVDEDIPPAIAQLATANVGDALALEVFVDPVGPVHVEHVVRAQRAVDEELGLPVSVRPLLAQQVP